jgi:hypothetical protein
VSGVDQFSDDPDAISPVWRSDRPSTHHHRPCVVTERLQVSENPVSASSSQSRDILNEDPRRTTLANEPRHFLPETGACSSDPGTLPGGANVLAGESAGDEIDSIGKSVGCEGPDVIEKSDVGPMLSEDFPTEGVDLALPHDGKACPLEAPVDASDSGKQ